MRALLILALLLGPTGPATANVMQDAITKRCKAQWPNDYSMRLFCIRQQADSAQEFIDLVKGEAASGDLFTILAVCYDRWGGSPDTADWPMVTFCYKQERKARDAVLRIEGD